MDKEVVLYTTHCPKCSVLEAKLKKAGIEYEECEDVDEMISLGFKAAPVLVVNEVALEFGDAVKWLNERSRA